MTTLRQIERRIKLAGMAKDYGPDIVVIWRGMEIVIEVSPSGFELIEPANLGPFSTKEKAIEEGKKLINQFILDHKE